MLLFAALLAASPVKIAEVKTLPICHNPESRTVAGESKAGIHRLGAEPPALHIRAVMRLDFDGCIKPVVIADRVGTPRR